MANSSSAESIFFAALGKTNPVERAAYLDQACRGDADLRRRVERLLEAHPQVSSFLEQPLAGNVAGEARAPGDRAAEASDRPDREKRDETQAERPGGDAAVPVPDFLTPSQKPDSLGRLDHYEILEVVGRGGMGVVLKGFDEKLRRVVAIKVLAPELAASGTARQRFTREARAAAAVSHEHVVTIYAVEEAHRPPYLVMEFVDGVSLQEKLDKEGPPGLKEILRIGLQTAEGLAAAHRQGLVHRDVKPENILLENGVERVKLTDFGLARAADDASLTQSGVIAGTPLYMSPEQAAGEPIDHRSDLFSLGSVLYALCTGRPPFRAGGTLAVLKRVTDDAPRPIAELNPEIPGWLCDLIARLHAKKPADRLPSAQAVADLLGQHLAHLQQPNQVAMPEAVAKPSSAEPANKRRRAGPVVAGLALLALGGGLLLAYLAGWLVRSPESPSQQPGPSAPAEKQPVAEAVLDELRRVVKAQQENLDRVRLNYADGRVSPLEACAAEVHLIEARIKLAEAERKPVAALLEDLVRVRDEELSQTEALLDAGRLPEADGLSAKARLSEARARLATARAESPPTKPFVLPGNEGRAEVGFATLAEAVAAARTGDAIEIRRNGPIVVDPIRVPAALAVRAAEGYRPVIQLSPEGVASNGAILDTKSPLILEGLEFHGPRGPSKAPGTPALIRARRASLHVAHCRFVVRGEGKALLVTCPADVTARNCEFEVGPNSSSALGVAQAGRSKFHIEGCVFYGRAAIDFAEPPEDMSMTFVNNTAWVTGPLLQVSQGSSKTGPAPTSKNPLRVRASGNIFYGEEPLVQAPARGQVIDGADAERLRRGVVHLDPGIPGKGAGPGGTDLGADVALVGPGEVYQLWTKTPEYHEWRKKTNALIQAQDGQPPTGVP
jgi:serine/threonine protein kinase